MSSTVVVTGAAGFIGSTLSRRLSDDGYRVVGTDYLSDDERWRNLEAANVADFVSPDELESCISRKAFGPVAAVFHQGACSDTTHRDGPDMMDKNFHQPVALVHAALASDTPFLYASSASVYGNNIETSENPANERPLNLYAFSKLQFDRYVRSNVFPHAGSTVVGLRYFNVYGEREQHKGRMSSVIHHFRQQIRSTGAVSLFEGSGGFGPGEQQRDFVCVDDVIAANRFFGLDSTTRVGIFNVGTGQARSFNDVARLVAELLDGRIEYIPFPDDLRGRYQHFTQADLRSLYAAGFPRSHEFVSIESGVPRVVQWLESNDDR